MFRQGLPARLKIRRSGFPVPLHEVIHEALDSDTVEHHVPLFFCGDVGFLYHHNDLLIEGVVYILINIVDTPRLLVYLVCVVLRRRCVTGPML